MQLKKFAKFEWLFLAVLIFLTIIFRTDRLEGKLTFEWDQDRDLRAVREMIDNRTPALLGPIVKGETGGFYLGPLYYYLITPFYLLSGGNPLSLAVVSVGTEVLLVTAFYVFLRFRVGRVVAASTALLWAGSPLLIMNSFTPWNVSLIPLWSLAFLFCWERLTITHSLQAKLAVVFLASLTSNIHFSLVPVAAVALLESWREFWAMPWRSYLLLAAAAFLPVSTLVLYDLTHDFGNLHLFKFFLFEAKGGAAPWPLVLSSIIEKFGYTLGRLFTGEPYTWLGWGVLCLALVYAALTLRLHRLSGLSALSILALLLSLFIYRDIDFAEYYLIPTFVPLLVLLSLSVRALHPRLPRTAWALLPLVCLVTYGANALHARSTYQISPYSLAAKRQVVQAIGALGYPVEMHTVLPRERNTGFDYLSKDLQVASDPAASRKAYIYESTNLEIVAPAEARSIILDQPIGAFKLVVFSP